MNTDRRYDDQPERSGESENSINTTTATTVAEPVLYANFAEWLDRDLSRLEDAYKGWATAGYGQWRRTFKTAR